MIFEDAMALLAAMERESVRYVMVGSMAMAANGLVRATRDVSSDHEVDRSLKTYANAERV